MPNWIGLRKLETSHGQKHRFEHYVKLRSDEFLDVSPVLKRSKKGPNASYIYIRLPVIVFRLRPEAVSSNPSLK